MDARDRRFTGWLLVVFGPLFVAGGFLAAFTQPGAWFIALGLAMVATGVAFLAGARPSLAASAGIAIAAGLIAWFEVDLRA